MSNRRQQRVAELKIGVVAMTTQAQPEQCRVAAAHTIRALGVPKKGCQERAGRAIETEQYPKFPGIPEAVQTGWECSLCRKADRARSHGPHSYISPAICELTSPRRAHSRVVVSSMPLWNFDGGATQQPQERSRSSSLAPAGASRG